MRDPNDDRVFTDDEFHKEGLGEKFKDFIKASGVKVWRKPLHRLRASRETELMEEISISVACKWIGNSPKIAAENYHKMRDVHFKNATQATPDFCPFEIASGSEYGSPLDQITDQHTPATTGKNEQISPQTETNCPFMPIPAQCFPNVQDTRNRPFRTIAAL